MLVDIHMVLKSTSQPSKQTSTISPRTLLEDEWNEYIRYLTTVLFKVFAILFFATEMISSNTMSKYHCKETYVEVRNVRVKARNQTPR